MSKEVRWFPLDVQLVDQEEGVKFEPNRVIPFKPFKHGRAVFDGFFGDEGKGREVDIFARDYKENGLRLLSVQGQRSRNARHTVVVEGKQYDFQYLTSATLLADIMLLGPGMLIDPIQVLAEAKKLPEEKRSIIMIAERASILTGVDRCMDSWCENQRTESGQIAIGTTKSGVEPGSGNRGYHFHITFADAKRCKDSIEFWELIKRNLLLPMEVEFLMTKEYAGRLWRAIRELNIVNSEELISQCREEGDWALLLEVSQCTDVGGAVGAGLTMYDFPDGSTMVLKAYGSNVGGATCITKFTPEEEEISQFIDQMVEEHGVTTGRKRDLGWFDGPAVRHSIALTGADICVNCMDVIAKLHEVTDTVKVCFAYKNIFTGEVTYNWPYHLQDWKPLYLEMSLSGKTEKHIIMDYIGLIEMVIGKQITGYGVGPSREDYRDRDETFRI